MKRYKFPKTGKQKFAIITERFLTQVVKVLSSKTPVNQRNLNNIVKLFESIDIEYYTNKDVSLSVLLKTIEIILGYRVLKDKEMNIDNIILEITSLLEDDYNRDTIHGLILPTIENNKDDIYLHDLEILNDRVDHQLKYGKIVENIDDLLKIINSIKGSTGTDLTESMSSFRTMISGLLEYFTETDNFDNGNKIIHTSDDKTLLDALIETYNKIKDPKYVLKTGIKTFNDFLGGGFKGSQLYMFYAKINSFKSGLLEQITRMVQTYNSGPFEKEFKETGRRPTILYISLENSLNEDLERFYKMYTHTDIDKGSSVEEMLEKWKHHYTLTGSVIDISLFYSSSNTISVDDIKKLIQVLNDSGRKVIMCVIDYFEMLKVRDEFKRLDQRLQYVKTSDGLLDLSKFFDIPFASAMQTNRAAEAAIMNAKENGEINLVMNLNNSNIAESYGMEKAVSFSSFINKETFKDEDYITFKLNKTRGKRSDTDYFVHKLKDGLIFDDDIYLDEVLSIPMLKENDESLNFRTDTNINKIKGENKKTVSEKITLTNSNKNNDSNSNRIDLMSLAKKKKEEGEEQKVVNMRNRLNMIKNLTNTFMYYNKELSVVNNKRYYMEKCQGDKIESIDINDKKYIFDERKIS